MAGPRPRVLAVAHRGDPYRHRENTLPSVESAFAAGADAVEVDVQLTRDGVPVLLHDLTLRRLWDDQRAVGSLTLARLEEEVGRPGLRVPTLAEALKTAAAHPEARLLLDLDEPGPAAAAHAVVRELGAGHAVGWCGPAGAMLAVRSLDPDAELALTWKLPQQPPAALLTDLRPRYLNPPFGLLDDAFVRAAADSGLAVSTWTADRRRTMTRLLALGVASVTSNRIGLLRRVVDGTR
ncbi:glycerophosphodiester phosphodiesterase [Kitasatospora sp. NPDC096147]|uniref:glycerophosphodiester phosphodiesterase n=1 Tax=Kitasatospora sp. NPDC096147 TaxID=3364093 RepID=UPI003802CF1A